MKVRSRIKAGGIQLNHSQRAKALRVRTAVKAGGLPLNHNQSRLTP